MASSNRRGSSTTPAATRILLVWNAVQGVGGTETRMAEVLGAWRDEGVEFASVVLGSAQQGRFEEQLERAGSAPEFAPDLRSFRRVVTHHNADVLLAFGLRASMNARLVSATTRRSIRVVDARNGLEFDRSDWLWRIDRATQRLVHRFVTNSHAAAEELIGHGIRRDCVTVLESALGPEWLSMAEVERDAERVIMVGNRRSEKNHELGLRAIAACEGVVRASIYTDDARDLRAFWNSIKHDDDKSIEFIEGHRITPLDMARAAIILHPSTSESLPRVLLEARSQGVRVVATDVGDTARILGPDDHLVSTNDFEATVRELSMALRQSRAGQRVGAWQAVTLDEYSRALLELCEISL